MRYFYRLSFIIFTLIYVHTYGTFQLSAEELPVSLKYSGGTIYYFVERSNWSKYINGKYVGLTHRETRAQLKNTGKTKDGSFFEGYFYRLEETLRDMSQTSRAIDEITEASFIITPTGTMLFKIDNGFPQLRSFPVFPADSVQKGDKWQAEGIRIIDPRNDGKRTTLPIMVEYEFIGQEKYKDTDVYRLKAKYASRLNQFRKSKNDDPHLQSASGSHDVNILIDVTTGAALLILDQLDETFFYDDGSSIRYKGSTALFTDTPVARESEKLISGINEIAKSNGVEAKEREKPVDDLFGDSKTTVPKTDKAEEPIKPIASPDGTKVIPETIIEPFTVETTKQGIRLSVRDIRFLPDKDTILESEKWRLDTIAQTLKLAPNGRFLVEGHTASVGKLEGEKILSVARAKKVVEELTARGLRADQFIFTGYGGSKPIADNKTNEGRAQNRRVEITILD